VHSWRFGSDTGASADNDDTSAVNDDDDDDTSRDDNADDHVNTRVQAFLRAELRQLVVQMLMVLLQRVFAMRSNNHQQHDSPSNDYNNLLHSGYSITWGLQALVCEHRQALDKEVQAGKVFWLC